VVAYRLGNLPEALSFYSDGVYLREVSSFPDLVSHLSRDARVYALADAADLARLPDGLRRSLEVVYSAEMSRMKVVLVANQARPADSGR
jgi:hypothetical protein